MPLALLPPSERKRVTLEWLETAQDLSEQLQATRSTDVGVVSHMSAVAPEGMFGSGARKRSSDSQNEAPRKAERAFKFTGCSRLKNLNQFLSQIDSKGFERSNHQCRFHEAFTKACGRTIYREEWGVHRTEIMRKNGWATDKSEVMISTPRRFGKTFRSRPHVQTRCG